MKKIFQIIGVVTLMIGSFIYTQNVQKASITSDTLLNEIKSKKDGYKENAIEPIIKDNTISPGINGKEVDVKKSYEEMSKIGYFDDKLLVYKKLPVENTLDKNKDKYIVSLNNSKMNISIIFKVASSEDITSIVKILDKKNIKATFFITSTFLEKHHNQIIDLIERGYTIGNLSNNEDYEDSDFIWMKTIITNIGNQKYNYCLTNKPNKIILNNCKIQNSYTIMTENIINTRPLTNIKKMLKPGNIIIMKVNEELKKEIEVIVNYIDSRGYNILPLEEGLKE